MQKVSTAHHSPSIREVLNRLARRESDIPASELFSCLSDLSDLDAWIGTDACALTLYKRYLDARAAYLQVLTKHKKDSVFSQTAADMADSAWCALEARLYELRADKAAAARAAVARKASHQVAQEARLIRPARHTAQEDTRRQAAAHARQNQTLADFLLFWYWCRYVVGGLGGPLPPVSLPPPKPPAAFCQQVFSGLSGAIC